MVTGTSLSLCAWAVCTFFATMEDGSRTTTDNEWDENYYVENYGCSEFVKIFSAEGGCGSSHYTWFIFAGLYFLHFMEGCCRSGTEKFIKNMSDPRQSADFLQNLTQAPPDMVWVAENYHYETHSYQDSDGNTQTRTEKVVTSDVRAKVCRGLRRIP